MLTNFKKKKKPNICLQSNFAVTKSKTILLSGDTKEGQRSCIFSACLYCEAQLNKQCLLSGLRTPTNNTTEGWNYLKGWWGFCWDLAGWHCFVESKSTVAHHKYFTRQRTLETETAETIRRLMSIPTACSFMDCQELFHQLYLLSKWIYSKKKKSI